ncbi:MAG: DMT family transporter [Caldiserica bacterium]|nr:DMT family transporter [Caldisericota bacterium]
MGPRPGPRSRTLLSLVIGVTSISFAAILIRLTRSHAVTVAAWRMALAGLPLLPVLAYRRPPRGGTKHLLLSLLSGIFLALHFSLWISSLRYTTVASSVVLVTTNPLFVGLFSVLLGERPNRRLWEGIFISFAGAVMIGWGDFALGGRALWGDVLALLGAVMASAYLLVGRRRELGLFPYISLAYGTAGALLLLSVAIVPGGEPLPLGGDWPWIALLALGPQLLGHTSLNWALRFLPAAAVALAILGEPLLSSLWAYLIFGEAIGPLQGAGFALVLAGIARGLGATSGVG